MMQMLSHHHYHNGFNSLFLKLSSQLFQTKTPFQIHPDSRMFVTQSRVEMKEQGDASSLALPASVFRNDVAITT
ncbi:hypothetical protein OUZ56_015601 [Daphnia magna]|uniref:Uncharacterized protein n=1 Tax=Daphnia magna TaxID=35525 RepID=A0ABR0AN98_9CRUS|nr:hypothetical protein OUZ56_015601 [Daphnia magna]